MFEITDFEKCYNFKFSNGDKSGFVVYKFTSSEITILTGKNTEGEEISSETIENGVKGKINPTKVFLFIAKVLKKNLCPECI